MKIRDILRTGKTCFSFEFSPPRTDKGWENLFGTIAALLPLAPAYVSVTYGAGGSTRDNTHKLVTRIKKETGIEVVAHLTCVGSSPEDIRRILGGYRASGIENVLALRGDDPKDQGPGLPVRRDFAYAADLIRFIRASFPEMGVGVAGFVEGHPAAPNRLLELDYLKEKVDAGADYIVTQLFFDNRDYYDFVERCDVSGIRVPVIAGIMPITSRKNMVRMAELAPRSRYPARLLKALDRTRSDDYFENVGVHWATEQILDLLDHRVPGVHLYTLNSSRASIAICEQLGLSSYGDIP